MTKRWFWGRLFPLMGRGAMAEKMLILTSVVSQKFGHKTGRPSVVIPAKA